MFTEVVNLFLEKFPISMMVRGLLERSFPADEVQTLFRNHADRQYERKILFSELVDLMSVVVCNIHPNIHAAIKKWAGTWPTELKATYEKINNTEPNLGKQLVQHSARKLKPLLETLSAVQPAWLEGYRVRIIDGNHHAATHRRYKETRNQTAAPLPGFTLVVYEPALDLVTDIFPCEDGYESERNIMNNIHEQIEPNDLWIADRHFCTTSFFTRIHQRSGAFVIREHAQNAPWQNETPWVEVGTTETGTVYEQRVILTEGETPVLRVRRIKIILNQSTRKGETEIYLLTNLPDEHSALVIAQIYHRRWTIETAFQHIEFHLNSEIPTLAHPRAALFVFAIALTIFNIYRVVRNVVGIEHGPDEAKSLSGYDVANEIERSHLPIEELVDAEYWEQINQLPLIDFVNWLRQLARKIILSHYRKAKQYPKKKKAKPVHDPQRPHVSTHRILKARKKRK